MFAASSNHEAKVVILGAAGVGKTCIGARFVKDQFVGYTASTIGASFFVKELTVGAQKITLSIWDTSGQDRFRSMAPLYYRGAVAAIFVFSITDEDSFVKMKNWVRELQSNVEGTKDAKEDASGQDDEAEGENEEEQADPAGVPRTPRVQAMLAKSLPSKGLQI